MRGRVFTWTVSHRPFDPHFADELPYAIVVVETDEGVRVVGNPRGIPVAELALDLPVALHLDRVRDDLALIRIGPA